jgi:hypothetical protein
VYHLDFQAIASAAIAHWPAATSILSLVIAFVAAFRPELHSLLRPRKIDILLTDSLRVEIGFAGVGPTLGVLGTLNNEHAKSLITKMRVRIRLPNVEHEMTLSPMLNRERALNRAFAGGEEARGKIWLPFLIDADAAVPFDVVFRYEPASVDLTKIGADLERSWNAYLTIVAQQDIASWSDPNPVIAQTKLEAFTKATYEASSNEQFRLSARDAFIDQFVWDAGYYDCRLEVQALNCRRVFCQPFAFSLSDDDKQRLLQNVDQMIAIVCKQLDPNTPLNFAYPELILAEHK